MGKCDGKELMQLDVDNGGNLLHSQSSERYDSFDPEFAPPFHRFSSFEGKRVVRQSTTRQPGPFTVRRGSSPLSAEDQEADHEAEDSLAPGSHSSPRVALVIVAALAYSCSLIVITFTIYGTPKKGSISKLFSSTECSLLVPRSTLTSTILAIVTGVFQCLFVCYMTSCLCRKNTMDVYLYLSPRYLSDSFYTAMILFQVLGMSWVRTTSGGDVIWGVALSCFWFVGGLTCLTLAAYGFDRQNNLMRYELVSEKEKWLFVCLVLNTFACTSVRNMFTALQMLAVAIKRVLPAGKNEEVPSCVFLGLTTILVVVFSSVDIFCVERYMRYVLGHYVILLGNLFGLVASLHSESGFLSSHPALLASTYTVSFVATFFFMLKLNVALRRHWNSHVTMKRIMLDVVTCKCSSRIEQAAVRPPS